MNDFTTCFESISEKSIRISPSCGPTSTAFGPVLICDFDSILPQEDILYRFDMEVSVFDVAAYILEKIGEVSSMKLQKLVYYCQAWSLVWDEKPLFKERIEAWANGPVIRELFNYHRGEFRVNTIPLGNPALLNKMQKETIDAVIGYYGNRTAQQLIEMTHLEEPWKRTRYGLPAGSLSSREITHDLIAEYYSSL